MRWLGLALAVLGPAPLPAAEPDDPAAVLPAAGEVLERTLSGDEAHLYRLPSRGAEALWITVLQKGVDLTVSVLGGDGVTLFTVDSPGGLWGEEWLYLRAEGAHGAVEIRTLDARSAPGGYRLSVRPLPPATPAAPERRLAERAATAAGRLYHDGDREALPRVASYYREALAGWQAQERSSEAARTLFLLGKLHRELDDLGQALPLLRQAHRRWRELGDRYGQAQALTEIASASRLLGEDGPAEETYLQALELWRDLGDLHGQARTLNYLGLIGARTAPGDAPEPLRQALELFREIGDVPQEGVVLNNLGGVYDRLGEPRQALEHFRQALAIHRRLGDLRQEAAVWNNIASLHRRTGRLQEALDGYNASLRARRQLGDRRGEGRVLNNLGLSWLALGDPARARDALEEALLLRRASEDRRGEAITLYNLGLVHAELDAWRLARDYWTRSLDVRRVLKDRRGEVAARVALGRAAVRLGRPAAAREHLEHALSLLGEAGNPWRRAQALWVLGMTRTAAGEIEEAIDVLERSLELYRATGDEVGEGDVLLALARAEESAGRVRRAYAHASAALDLLEAVRADVDSLGLRASFLSHRAGAFEVAIGLAMELDRRQPGAGWSARALEISERARSRSLVDLLKEAGAGLRRGVDPALLARQQDLLDHLNARVSRRRLHLDRRGPSADSERLRGEIRDLLTRLDDVDREIRRQDPGWDVLTRPQPLEADAVRALLDPDTTLFEFALGEERSFLWVVTAQEIASFELPGRERIEEAARQVYERLLVHDPRELRADRDAARRLSELVLAPAAAYLSAAPEAIRRLAIVADGALHYLPFAALPNPAAPSEPLLARHEVVSLPSASALAALRRAEAGRRAAGKRVAVLADPVFDARDPRLSGPLSGVADLPGPSLASQDSAYVTTRSGEMELDRLPWSRWEAEAIAGHAGEEQSLVALDFDADLAAVRDGRLRGYRVVHFATHGIVESEHPELSALVLSLYDGAGRPQDGFLRLPEIYNLDLDAELVVLSGCRTALGRELRGEGLVGLTRGFFAAGARQLVASLWRVQDRASAELMDRFYARLLAGEPMRPAAALREAQLALRAEPEFADPYHWAAFAVFGDWR